MPSSSGSGGGGGGGGSGSGGGITDLGGWIKNVFGKEDAISGKVVQGMKDYKELEKDIGGSALGKSSSAPTSLNQPMQLKPSAQSKFGFENNFYGHYLPEHFKKTSIINTKGRVR